MKVSKFILLVALAFSPLSGKCGESYRQEALRLLGRLDSALLARANTDKASHDYGGVYCDGCRLYHTRAAEAVYPFAMYYKLTGSMKYLDAAINAGLWLMRQQNADGSWFETPEKWTGTTTDQALMMALAYPVLCRKLPEAVSVSWLKSVERAADYLSSRMSPGFASINYCATTTATLMCVNKLVPRQRYVEKADSLAAYVVSRMDADGFISGEGGRSNGVKYGVDLGYDFEMSLWGLAIYAVEAGNRRVADTVFKSICNHLSFIYPDGSLDNSWGIRSNKWTCYGGATSDGIVVPLALYANRDGRFLVAALRNLRYVESCSKNGIIGFGPQYFKIFSAPPCIYPTFTKAKAIAMSLSLLPDSVSAPASLPLDADSIIFHQTLNVVTVRKGDWCATVSCYPYKDMKGSRSKYMHRPDGGSISYLWVDGYGILQAASQSVYRRWEPMTFPVIGETLPLTPRIEFTDHRGWFTNLYEFDGIMSVGGNDECSTVSASGELKDCNGCYGGVYYRLTHNFSDSVLVKTFSLRCHDYSGKVRIVEPVVLSGNSRLSLVGSRKARVAGNGRIVEIELMSDSLSFSVDGDASKYYSVFPSLRAVPLVVEAGEADNRCEDFTIKYKVIK